jgi:putative phosphoesterase
MARPPQLSNPEPSNDNPQPATRISGPRVIGLIADTHGLVRPELAAVLARVEVILHAGDVGGADVLRALRKIAPVEAVFGNVDPPDDRGLSREILRTWNGVTVHVSHGHEVGRPTPEKLLACYDADVIVFGHTHRPLVARVGRRLVVNPGAAGPRRFDLRPSVARLTISPGSAEVEIVPLRENTSSAR